MDDGGLSTCDRIKEVDGTRIYPIRVIFIVTDSNNTVLYRERKAKARKTSGTSVWYKFDDLIPGYCIEEENPTSRHAACDYNLIVDCDHLPKSVDPCITYDEFAILRNILSIGRCTERGESQNR